MKRRKEVKKRKSMIQNPALERPTTLEQALNAGMATCGLHCCRIKFFYQDRIVESGSPYVRGLPIVIGVLDARDYCECVWWENHTSIESYIQENFGSGTFEVGLYDENNSELGRYRYYIGGAPEYIHTSKASDDEDSDIEDQIKRLFMELFRDYRLEEDEI